MLFFCAIFLPRSGIPKWNITMENRNFTSAKKRDILESDKELTIRFFCTIPK